MKKSVFILAAVLLNSVVCLAQEPSNFHQDVPQPTDNSGDSNQIDAGDAIDVNNGTNTTSAKKSKTTNNKPQKNETDTIVAKIDWNEGITRRDSLNRVIKEKDSILAVIKQPLVTYSEKGNGNIPDWVSYILAAALVVVLLIVRKRKPEQPVDSELPPSYNSQSDKANDEQINEKQEPNKKKEEVKDEKEEDAGNALQSKPEPSVQQPISNSLYADSINDGYFKSVKVQPNDDTVFELIKDDPDGKTAVFKIYSGAENRVLRRPDSIDGCDVQQIGKSSLEVEKGTATFEDGKWKVTEKAKVKFV
ncbi:hypothetical protein AGMMS49982_04600 [Bacteroidia bacterium]|nr:hypothetical protein AGMMS49982_04600 [Bacteroidia bacterium]